MKKFWNWIKNSDDTRILRLEGPIDEESFWGDEITPQMFRDELESGEGDVTVWINSPGGNVFAAAEIYTMLKDYKGSITVKIKVVVSVERGQGRADERGGVGPPFFFYILEDFSYGSYKEKREGRGGGPF